MITKKDQDARDALGPVVNLDHRTAEARALNPDRLIGTYHYSDSDRQARRRALLVLLPPGRILDELHLAHVMDQGNMWSVHHGPRQLLMEAGAKVLARQLILSEAELEQLEEFAQDPGDTSGPVTMGPRISTTNPVSAYPRAGSSS